MTASRREALLRLRKNRRDSGPEARPSFLAPADAEPERDRSAGLTLRPMALGKVAEAAIARSKDAGGSSRDLCEAAFRALLEREPYLPVANAQRIIDEALARQGGKRPRLAGQPAIATGWVVFSTVVALLAAVAAVPLAIAMWSSWWSPGSLQTFGSLSIVLALTLPTALLIFPALAWRSLIVRRPGLAAVLAGLPLIHITGTAASFAFP